jgi:hypothetical protein
MPIILPNNTLAIQLPQPGVMVRAGRNQVRGISAEGAVPDPALVAVKRCLERESIGVAFCGEVVLGPRVVRLGCVDGPDARGVVGGASC